MRRVSVFSHCDRQSNLVPTNCNFSFTKPVTVSRLFEAPPASPINDEMLLPPAKDLPSWRLYLVIVIAQLLPFLLGYSVGYTSPNFADCDSSDAKAAMNCELHLSSEQKSLFGSIVCIGALVGALSGGPVVDPFGRKAGMLGAALLYAIGWVCIAAAPTPHADATSASAGLLTALLLGRTVSGVAIGLTCCVVNIYVSELAPITSRGAFGTLYQVNALAGLLFCYFCGIFMTWRSMAWLVAILSSVVAALLLAVPESPQWLVQKGKRQKAEAVLQALRTDGVPLEAIIDGWNIQSEVTSNKDRSTLQELCKSSTLRPLLVGVGLALLKQFCGINAIVFYCGEIFTGVFDKKTADAAAVGAQVVHLLMTMITIPLMDKVGRRILLLSSAIGMAACSFLFGLYFALDETPHVMPKFFPTAVLYGYMISFAAGMGSIPWLIIGEIFPPHSKGICSSIATAVNWGSSFIITKTVVNLKDAVGYVGMFWIYSGFLLLGMFFIYFYVPETKGRSFAQIQETFVSCGSKEDVAASIDMQATEV